MRLLRYYSLFFPLACFSSQMRGQCTTQVNHTSGTLTVGCTEVTVTSEGSVGNLNYCAEFPYWIGAGSNTGSYIFTFSPPVTGVSLGLTAINNQPTSKEEIRFEINGVFYPITVPGTPGFCFTPAVITPTGTVGAMSGQVGAWGNMDINTTISTLKVENVILLAGSPNGSVFSLFICSACCETDAGSINSSPINVCPGNTATVPPAGQSFLEADDVLQYILFSNPADTLGSILGVSSTPEFDFAAPMQIGVTYYIAAIAGNNLGGNVDLNDPCLDISNAIQVIWRPLPTVAFSVANPDVCAGGCTTATATFTGTAPFTLTYTTPVGATTQTFTGNTGTFQVCTATGSAPGSFSVAATVLTDAWCTCN